MLFQPAGGGPAAARVTDTNGRYCLETADTRHVPGERKVTVTKVTKGIREEQSVNRPA